MDFTFSDEQRMMATAVRELLDDVCTPAQLRLAAGTAEAGEGTEAGGDDAERWARLVELGLPGMLAPEAAGGMGLTDIDFVLVAEEAGRAALPEPLVEQAGIAVPLLAALSSSGSGSGGPQVDRWLQRAASGEARVAIKHPLNPTVLGAASADAFILFHQDEVHLVEREAVKLVRQPSIDRLRALATLDWLPDTDTCIADGTAGAVLRKLAFARGTVATAAQLLGLTDRMVRIAVDYASARQQFGKVIGTYQALKHQLADVAVQLEYAKPVVYAAAARLAEMTSASTSHGFPALSQLRGLTALVSGARLMAGEAAELASRRAMQVHGAMGYSWEVDLHFYMKRAWALGGSWGDRAWHQRRMEAAVLEGEGVGALL